MSFDKAKFDEFSIRVPKELTEFIQRDAKVLKRSRNMQVNAILEKYYRDDYQKMEHDQEAAQNASASMPNL